MGVAATADSAFEWREVGAHVKKYFGICRLTGRSGQYVKSHIIPKTLTRPDTPGSPFIEGGFDQPPVRRWSSWNDHRLVIRKGEDVLSALDNWAVPVLRSHHLVWSGWNGSDELPATTVSVDAEGRGARRIHGIDPARFRLFTLSLLWRAAASNLPSMTQVALPPSDLSKLGSLLLNRDPGELSFYPSEIIKLSTRGIIHNSTPTATIKFIPNPSGDDLDINIPIFRIYFDGMILHFHDNSNDILAADFGDLIVGCSESLIVTTIPYEVSRQRDALRQAISHVEDHYPEVMKKLKR